MQSSSSCTNNTSHHNASPYRSLTQTFITNGVPGMVGRLPINNLLKSVSDYENTGKWLFDSRLSTLRSAMVGKALQTTVVYSMKDAWIHENDPIMLKALKAATIGAGGGLMMQPASVRFYLSDEFPTPRSRYFPVLSQMGQMLQTNPTLFCRGAHLRMAASGVGWGTFFSAKDLCIKKLGLDVNAATATASCLSIAFSSYLMGLFIASLHGHSKPSHSPTRVNIALFSLFTVERFTEDVSRRFITHNTSPNEQTIL